MQISSVQSGSYPTTITNYTQNMSNTTKEDMEGEAKNRKGLHERLSMDYPTHIANSIEKLTDTMPFFDAIIFTSQLQMTLSDYSAGKEINSPYMVGDGFDGKPIHTDKLVTKNEVKNINFDDFLIKALKSFEDGINSSKGKVQDSYIGLFNNFSDLKQNYDKQKSEPIYA